MVSEDHLHHSCLPWFSVQFINYVICILPGKRKCSLWLRAVVESLQLWYPPASSPPSISPVTFESATIRWGRWRDAVVVGTTTSPTMDQVLFCSFSNCVRNAHWVDQQKLAFDLVSLTGFIFMRLYFTGCDFFFDGLVCWPSTPLGEEAGVNCWSIEAFARALGKNNKSGIHGRIVGVSFIHFYNIFYKLQRFSFENTDLSINLVPSLWT